MIEIEISAGRAKLLQSEVLTAGRVGLRCRLHFDSAWDGLHKTAVVVGSGSVDLFLPEDEFRIPAECLRRAGDTLRIGLYGVSGDGGVVIPTVWVNCGEIRAGTVLSDQEEQERAPDLLAQIMALASEARAVAARLQTDADRGVFNGAAGPAGADGSTIWTTAALVIENEDKFVFQISDLSGPAGAALKPGDLIVQYSGDPAVIFTYCYVVSAALPAYDTVHASKPRLRLHGEDGADGEDGAAIWKASIDPRGSEPNRYFLQTDLSGERDGAAVGDLVFSGSSYYRITGRERAMWIVDAGVSIRGPAGPAGTTDYAELSNKPLINSVALSGNKSAAELSLLGATGNAYRSVSIPMGQVDDTSTAAAFTATVPGITELRDGVCCYISNGVVTSAEGFTLNVNGLGAKPCYVSNAAATRMSAAFNAAFTYLFIYNSTRVSGGCWDAYYGYDSNTTYTPAKMGFGSGEANWVSGHTEGNATISGYNLVTGGIVFLKLTSDVPGGATLNISSKGAKPIYYEGVTIPADFLHSGAVVTLAYDGSVYNVIATSDWETTAYKALDEVNNCVKHDTLSTDLADVSSENIAVILTDAATGTVVIQSDPGSLLLKVGSQLKTLFALVVPPNYYEYPVIFSTSSFSTETGELKLFGIADSVLYQATMNYNGTYYAGTLTQTNLALLNDLVVADNVGY